MVPANMAAGLWNMKVEFGSVDRVKGFVLAGKVNDVENKRPLTPQASKLKSASSRQTTAGKQMRYFFHT